MSVVHLRTDTAYFSDTPNEVTLKIFGFLPELALRRSLQVCKVWNQLINEDNFPWVEWDKDKCEAGNEKLRKAFEKYSKEILHKPPSEKMAAILKKTSTPFSDRKRIVNYILDNKKESSLSSTAWRSATEQMNLPLCETFLPLVRNTCFLEQGICIAIQQGHVDLVKRLLPELHEKRAREKICIQVEYPTNKGESLSLRGFIGAGPYDLNSWEKGFPMKKVRGKDNLWEIILLPVVYGETTQEYDSSKDKVLFPFKPVLHLADGRTLMALMQYSVRPRADITIVANFSQTSSRSSSIIPNAENNISFQRL